jgi:aspartate aminotransferase-like enzyme
MSEHEPIRFFVPGPSYVLEDVRQAMTAPVDGHRSAAFRAVYARVAERLPPVFRTAGEVMVATGSATLLMESALVSTTASTVLNLTCGAFSERWYTIARSLGRDADRVSVPWGRPIDPDLVRAALARRRYEAVTVVHSETSTGVLNPVAEIARVVREESDALVLVDAVSSLAGAPLETDAWGLDLVLTGAQKALAVPPGLALFALSERAAERAAALPHRGFYTDLLRYRTAHREGSTITTPAVSIFFALDRQLERILAEGMEARWERHRALRDRTLAWADERGFAAAAAEGYRSPTVTCLRPPQGTAAPELVRRLAAAGFTLGGGYGEWKGSTFRIGHMGEVRSGDLDALLAAVDAALAAKAAEPALEPATESATAR